MLFKRLRQQLGEIVSALRNIRKDMNSRFFVDVPFNELQGAKYGDLITIHTVNEDGLGDHIIDKGMLLKYGVKTENTIFPPFNGVETRRYVVIKDLISKNSKKYYIGRIDGAPEILLYVRLYSALK